MNLIEIRDVVKDCKFMDYTFFVDASSTGFIYLGASYEDEDTVTGKPELQLTRRWPISPKMTKSEIVSTAFKCVITSMEHRTREGFLYKNRAIYMPHFNVDDLWDICEDRDSRTEPVNDIIFTAV